MFELLLGTYNDPFADVISPDSSSPLEFCISLFICLKLPSAPLNFISCLQVKVIFVGPVYVLGLSLTLYRYRSSTLLAPACGRILNLECLLSILQCIRPALGHISPPPSKVVLQLKAMGSPFPHRPCFVFYM